MSEIMKDKPFYDRSGGGVTLSGGEPLLQAEFVCAFCDALHASGITVAIETAANAPSDIFASVLKKCDQALIDIKHWNEESHLQGTGVDNRQILANIRYAFKQNIPVTLRIPVIPGYNDSATDAMAFASLLKELGARDVQLLPFHQLGDNKYDKLNTAYAYSGVSQLLDEDLKEYAGILSASGLQVQIGG